LLAAGAFAALGDFNIFLLVAVAGSASICGDNCGYLLGRKIFQYPETGSSESLAPQRGRSLAAYFKKPRRSRDSVSSSKRRIRFISPQVLERSREYFHQHGALAILLSRCVVTAFGGCINILAGAERYPYRRFLLYDVIGEIIGAALPLTLGYIFGASWEAIGTLLTTLSLLVVAILVVVYLTIQLVRTVRRIRAAGQAKKVAQSVSEIFYDEQEGSVEPRV
jgi:membrane-associated protein